MITNDEIVHIAVLQHKLWSWADGGPRAPKDDAEKAEEAELEQTLASLTPDDDFLLTAVGFLLRGRNGPAYIIDNPVRLERLRALARHIGAPVTWCFEQSDGRTAIAFSPPPRQ